MVTRVYVRKRVIIGSQGLVSHLKFKLIREFFPPETFSGWINHQIHRDQMNSIDTHKGRIYIN